jgi:hypothetical protein
MIFEQPIWRGNYPGDLSALKARTLELFNTSKTLAPVLVRAGGLSSSTDPDNPHLWPEAEDFINWLMREASGPWVDWRYDPEASVDIHRSWANIYPQHAYAEEHNHGDVAMAVILYLHQPRDGGNLEVHNPNFYHWQGYSQTDPTKGWTEVPVKNGDVVIIPGWMMHRSQPNQNLQQRIILSFNLIKT